MAVGSTAAFGATSPFAIASANVGFPPSRPFATVAMEGSFGIRAGRASPTRGGPSPKYSQRTPPAPRQRQPRVGPTPHQRAGPALPADRDFGSPYEISYRGVKLSRVSAGVGRFCLRRGADLPQVRNLDQKRATNKRTWLQDHCRQIYPERRRPERSPAFGEDDLCPALQLCGSTGSHAC
jgi:hypothetical protein